METNHRRRARRRRNQIIAGIVVLILLVLIGLVIYFINRGGGEAPSPADALSPSPSPQSTPVADESPMAEEPTRESEQPAATPEATSTPTADEIAKSIWTSNIQQAQETSSGSGQSPTAEPTVEPTAELRLSGVKIGIDPGHQQKANSEKEPIAPDSSKTKAKVSSGTQGVKTRVPEYQVVLDVSLQLRDALEALGAEVYMTRETNDVDISNIERAQMMNELRVDLVLRIHCDGSENREVNGIGLFIRKTGTNADECLKAAEALLPAMVEATGAKKRSITQNDTYTGLNWSEVPSILVEMGYMSNPEEDVLLNDPEYQAKLVEGMVEGIADYMGR